MHPEHEVARQPHACRGVETTCSRRQACKRMSSPRPVSYRSKPTKKNQKQNKIFFKKMVGGLWFYREGSPPLIGAGLGRQRAGRYHEAHPIYHVRGVGPALNFRNSFKNADPFCSMMMRLKLDTPRSDSLGPSARPPAGPEKNETPKRTTP